jgi:DNA-binding CsgD family transcriptional regulator
MSGMPPEFHAGVERAHKAARRHREKVAQIRRNARETPELLAAEIMEAVPRRLLELQVVATRDFGLELTSAEQIRSFAATSVAEWQLVSWLANQYQMYSACLQLVTRYVEDPNLTGVRFARTVCEAFLEALERLLYAVALDFEQLRRMLPEQQFVSEELAKALTGITATRISLHTNLRLRKQIDELREGSKQKTKKRERFEQLLLELPTAVLDAWEKAPHPVVSLDAIRTEATAKLESRSKVRPEAVELAAFADREILLKWTKALRLSPQEQKFFELITKDPTLKYREIADQLGISTSQVGVIKHRIKRKRAASF